MYYFAEITRESLQKMDHGQICDLLDYVRKYKSSFQIRFLYPTEDKLIELERKSEKDENDKQKILELECQISMLKKCLQNIEGDISEVQNQRGIIMTYLMNEFRCSRRRKSEIS